MNNVEKKLWEYFHVKTGDNLPYTGWLQSTRTDIYKFMGTLGFKYGAEIGVRRGRNAKDMFNQMPNLQLLCVDTWRPYKRGMSEKRAEEIYKSCQQRLKDCNAQYLRMTSVEASKQVKDGSLDFVYIDAMHDFDNVMTDIITWVPKVKKEGIISGHDYFKFYQSGVIEAVKAYTIAHNIQNWHITRVEKEPSWFWVNV